MPAGRIILKSISGSKKLSKLKSDGARLLYTWLIPHVDVNGCFSADPIVINGQVLTRLNVSIHAPARGATVTLQLIGYQCFFVAFLRSPIVFIITANPKIAISKISNVISNTYSICEPPRKTMLT